jgi:hypothetical protein
MIVVMLGSTPIGCLRVQLDDVASVTSRQIHVLGERLDDRPATLARAGRGPMVAIVVLVSLLCTVLLPETKGAAMHHDDEWAH